MSTNKIFLASISIKSGWVESSKFRAIEVKISQEYSAYSREASVEETARFILLAATSSIALVIFLVLLTYFILFLISLLFDIIYFPRPLSGSRLWSGLLFPN